MALTVASGSAGCEHICSEYGQLHKRGFCGLVVERLPWTDKVGGGPSKMTDG